ncbi:MAG: DUF192 domain-containing protein [Pseudobdellovibrionaceae bacterium]
MMNFNQKLVLSHNNLILIEQLAEASNIFSRLKGLLGTQSLQSNQGLWILRCNSIHTFFMKFDIDCLFLSREMKVIDWRTNIPRRRMIAPIWKATSVVETSAGVIQQMIDKKQIHQGDKLHVCS